MREIVFKLAADTAEGKGKLEKIDATLDELKEKGEKGIYYTFGSDASGKLKAIMHDLNEVEERVEEPKIIKISAEEALGTIRDVKIAIDGVVSAIKAVTGAMNKMLDSALVQKQAVKLTSIAFGEASEEMQNFASAVQNVTNFGDERLLPLMAKMAQTYKLTKHEVKALTPVLLDFAEANAATGMTVETAYDLMGKALNGYTAMLGRYGIQLDDTRLKTEGVAYLVEKLAEDYGGTAEALADLRIQNANAWGDIKETVGDMISVIIEPLLSGLRLLMGAYNSLSPVMKGFVTGLSIAIPLVASATVTISALTTAVHALKTAINPVAGIIGIVVGVLSALGFAFASVVVANREAMDTQREYEQSVNQTASSVEQLVAKHREIALSIDYVEAKKRLQEVYQEIEVYRGALEKLENSLKEKGSDYWQNMAAHMAFWSKQKGLVIEKQELEARIAADDATARKKFNDERTHIEQESALSGIALLEFRLASEKQHYKELGMVTAENADEQITTLQKIHALESSLNQAKQKEIDDLNRIQERYDALAIENSVKRRQRELEIQRDTELAKATALGASEELLSSIRQHYADENVRIEKDAAEKDIQISEQEAAKKAQKLQEMDALRYEFNLRGLNISGQIYEAQIREIDRYYEQRREKLLEAGIAEEEITRQIEEAKEHLKEDHQMRELSSLTSHFSQLGNHAREHGKIGFRMWQASAIAQSMADTYSMAVAAYKALAGIPVVGPGLGAAAAAAAAAFGFANVGKISDLKYDPPKAATGGLLVGRTHSDGGIMIEAEGNEYITAKDRVAALGKGFFDFVNFGPIEQVKKALAGISAPNIPLPAPATISYSDGGIVRSGSNALLDMVINLNSAINKLIEKETVFHVHIDPLQNDPVRVSEIADRGRIIRSEI